MCLTLVVLPDLPAEIPLANLYKGRWVTSSMDGNPDTTCPTAIAQEEGWKYYPLNLNKEYPLLHYLAQTTRLAITRYEEERLRHLLDQLTAQAEVLFPKRDDLQVILLNGVADFVKDSLSGKVIYSKK